MTSPPTSRGHHLGLVRTRDMAYYALLDRTPRGGDERDTEPLWLRRHDEYETN